jgi:hypothetical protein
VSSQSAAERGQLVRRLRAAGNVDGLELDAAGVVEEGVVAGMHMYAPPEPWPPAVREFIETSRRKRAEHIAYRPHAGHEAADRGLRADRLAGRTRRPDRRPLPRVSATAAATSRHVFSRDQILTNLTIYWVTATIGPVMNGDCDFDHFAAPTPVR